MRADAPLLLLLLHDLAHISAYCMKNKCRFYLVTYNRVHGKNDTSKGIYSLLF